MKTILFFNNKGGVGKTTLVYHFAYMLSEMGYKTLAVDLDPQANLTSMFLEEERILKIYESEERQTILQSITPLMKAIGDIKPCNLEKITDNLFLIPGDLDLSVFEDRLAENWGKCYSGDEAAFRISSAFYRIIQSANDQEKFDFIVIDVGPNLGAINRSVFISADYLVVPVAADLFSLEGLKNLGTSTLEWEKNWNTMLSIKKFKDLTLPSGNTKALGYVVMQNVVTDGRPVSAYRRWVNRIPNTFRTSVMNELITEELTLENDKYCLALIKHYRSLMAMAQESRKPVFLLKPADGAIGAHFNAVRQVHKDFNKLTEVIISKCL
jgi:chromosome partitioning protein